MLLTLGVVAIVALGMFVVGVTATLEDEAPGGFDNPDGQTPSSTFGRRSAAVFRGAGIVLGALGGVYFVGTASNAGGTPSWPSVAFGVGLLALGAVLAWNAWRSRARR